MTGELSGFTPEELFVRYWDDALTADQQMELERLLATNAAVRESFQHFCIQTLVAADLPAIAATRSGALELPIETAPPIRTPARWTRRRALAYLGGGFAAALMAGVLGRRFWPAASPDPVRLANAQGDVRVLDARGRALPLSVSVPPGATLSTHGPISSAVLSYPGGADISFSGDSVVTVADDGRQLVLRDGMASARIPKQPPHALPLTLATAEATLRQLSGVVLTLGRVLEGTEVGVQQGQVNVAAPTGEPMETVRAG